MYQFQGDPTDASKYFDWLEYFMASAFTNDTPADAHLPGPGCTVPTAANYKRHPGRRSLAWAGAHRADRSELQSLCHL